MHAGDVEVDLSLHNCIRSHVDIRGEILCETRQCRTQQIIALGQTFEAVNPGRVARCGAARGAGAGGKCERGPRNRMALGVFHNTGDGCAGLRAQKRAAD